MFWPKRAIVSLNMKVNLPPFYILSKPDNGALGSKYVANLPYFYIFYINPDYRSTGPVHVANLPSFYIFI
jgi:hypothetical protein